MNEQRTYMIPAASDLKPETVYPWWNCDDEPEYGKKKKKKKGKKRKKKLKKLARREFGYRLLDKATDTVCEITEMYFRNKFNPSK